MLLLLSAASKVIVIRIPLVDAGNRTPRHVDPLKLMMVIFLGRSSLCHLLMEILQVLIGCLIVPIRVVIIFHVGVAAWDPPIFLWQTSWVVIVDPALSVLTHWDILPIWVLDLGSRWLLVHIQVLCWVSLVSIHNQSLGLLAALLKDFLSTSDIHVFLPHIIVDLDVVLRPRSVQRRVIL